MTPPNKREFNYGGLVAVILAVSLGLVLVFAILSNLVFDNQLTSGAAEVLKTISVGVVGALGVWLGHEIKRNGK